MANDLAGTIMPDRDAVNDPPKIGDRAKSRISGTLYAVQNVIRYKGMGQFDVILANVDTSFNAVIWRDPNDKSAWLAKTHHKSVYK